MGATMNSPSPVQEYTVYCAETDIKPEWAEKVLAYNHEHAAEEWAEQRDSVEVPTIGLGRWHPSVLVTDPLGVQKEYEIHGEMMPMYVVSERNT